MAPSKQPQTQMALHKTVVKKEAIAVESAAGDRPPVPPGISELFMVRGDSREERKPTVYRPALFGFARMHFVDAKAGVDCWTNVGALAPIEGDVGDNPWDEAEMLAACEFQTSYNPLENVVYAPLPAALLQAKNYAEWGKALSGHLYRNYAMAQWTSPALKEFSKPDESEASFRVRIAQRAREVRDEAVDKLRSKYGSKSAGLDDKILRARERVAREKSEFQSQSVDTAVSFGASILRALLGRKWASVTNVRGATSTARSASRAAKQHGDIERAQKELDALLESRAKLEDEFEEERARLEAEYNGSKIEAYTVRPRKGDLSVDKVVLAWLA
jgi:hypothetical protein